MSHEKAEIGATLKLDDHASHVLEKIKGGFEHLEEKAKETQHEVMGFLKQAAATAVGFNFMNGVDSIKEFGHEVMNASLEAKAQQKTLAGVLLLTDQTGASMKELSGQAGEIREEFERMGMEMGANKDEMISAFSAVAERSTKSTEEVQKFTESMFYAGKAVSGGMEAIGSGFAMIEMGNVRAGNAVVKLIAAQHLLKGTARDVAKQMQKMTNSQKIELAEKAVERMAKKLKPAEGADLGYKPVISALGQIREKMFEIVGNPLIASLSAQLNRVHRYFLENQKTIEHWAHMVGEKVGQWVTEAAETMRQGFEYMQNHAQEIKDAIVGAWTYAKDVMTFIIDNKEVLMMAYGAKTAVGAGQSVVSGLTAAGGGAGMLAGAATMAVFAAAAISWALAADQMVKFWKENGKSDSEKTADAYEERVKAMSGQHGALSKDDAKEYDKIRKAYLANAGDGHGAEAGQKLDAIMDQHKGIRAQDMGVEAAGQAGDAEYWVELYNKAAKAHDVGAQQYAADILGQSGALQEALVSSDMNVEGGFTNLIDMLKAKSATFAGDLQLHANDLARVEKATKAKSEVNYNGGQTFNIKQDYRDQDPDRIALLFQRDIIKAAENRHGARTAAPLGF
jgi:hypothetical protein